MFAIRGAISVSRDEPHEIEVAAERLTRTILERNALTRERVVSAYFTSTTDLVSAFPATGARHAGFQDVPMLCAQEIPVPTAPPRIIRVLVHVEGSPDGLVHHVYLGEAAQLRPDWAQLGD